MKQPFSRLCALLALLPALLALAGCNQPAPGYLSGAPVSSANTQQSNSLAMPSDQFYPCQSYGFNKDNTCLLVQNDNTITFINQQNQPVKTITLQKGEQSVRFDQGSYAYSSTRVCMLSSQSEQYAYVLLSESPHDDQLVCTPYNLALWDENGHLIKEFPSLDTTTDGISRFEQAVGGQSVYLGYVPINQAYWVDDNSLVLCGQTHIFWYNVSQGRLTCIDDMSQIAPPGKSWAYLGYANGYAQGGKFIYMAYKDRQMQNRCGSLWLADETGSRPLFDGQLFSYFAMQNGVLTAVQYQDKANTRMTIHYASLDDLALHDIDTPAASRFSFMQAGQDALFWCSEQHEEETSVLYCQNLSTGETASLTLAQEYLAYASFGYFENTLYFFYQTADGKVRAYNTQTQTDFLLPAFEAASYGSPLTVENGWPIEHKGDIFSSQSLRVCTQFARQLLQS